MRSYLLTLFAFVALAGSASAAPLDMQAVNDAKWQRPSPKAKSRINPQLLIKAQVLLDRAHFSPGEIDGKPGDNLKKALTAFAAAQGFESKGDLTDEAWQRLTATSAEPVLIEYTTSDEDLRGPFAEKIPPKLEEKQDLPALAYTSPREKIAEKFHMSPDLLRALNPKQKFETAGEKIVVANVTSADLPEKAVRIEVDKTAQMLRLFGKNEQLLAVYPATVGSVERPAPNGRLKITSITPNPTYTYNPKYAFKTVQATKSFVIKPGPNNPVGIVWIALAPGEGYGIHGTPEPSKVSKSESHGCVRLTNWDVLQVSKAVARGMTVEFSGDETARQSRGATRKESRR